MLNKKLGARCYTIEMKISEYEKMANAEDNYWWHIGRKSIIERRLKSVTKTDEREDVRILNIGCGTGGTIPMLEEHGRTMNVDTSPEAIKIARQRGIKELRLIGRDGLPFEDNSFDIIVALDVLEHIEEDLDALREWTRVLKKEGVIILTVPAYQWLWSEHDEALHHFRRYNASGLHKLLNLAGLKATKRSYIITSTLIPIVMYRLIKSILPGSKGADTSYVKLPRPVNYALAKILWAEGWCLDWINLPIGTSVLMMATKE